MEEVIMQITWKDFEKIDIRVGTIIEATEFHEAKNPAYKIKIDFGRIGIKQSSAQITGHYKTKDLIGKQVIAVINFPKKQIANFMSDCLILGVLNPDNNVILIHPGQKVSDGLKIC